MKARQWKIEKKDMEKESVRKKALSETQKCHQGTFYAGEEGSLKECLRGLGLGLGLTLHGRLRGGP